MEGCHRPDLLVDRSFHGDFCHHILDERITMDKAMLSELLIEFLEVDKAPCPHCGHTLHGIETDRCPACNIKLQLLIGSIDLYIAPWITAFVGCSIVIGMWIFVFFGFTMIAIEAGVVAGDSEMQLVLVTATLFIILGICF